MQALAIQYTQGADSANFWRGKRVFITGHTGFKGSWLAYWLHLMGAHVTGYARAPETDPSLFQLLALDELVPSYIGDITDATALGRAMGLAQPEFVFHLAAQAQVLPSFADPGGTFLTNVMGSLAVLDAVRTNGGVRVCQIVTSDKCYAQPGLGQAFVEGDALGGNDPYSASKAAAEIAVAAYRSAFFSDRDACSVATVRAGNALGAGDWSAQRILPNSIRALLVGKPIRLTHARAVRPWQYVLEPLSGYLCLAQHQFHDSLAYAEAWNFGPERASEVSVLELAHKVIQEWGSGTLECAPPDSMRHEEPFLAISIAKALGRLAWRPSYGLTQTLVASVRTYKSLYAAMDSAEVKHHVRALCLADIAAYTQTARNKGIAWSLHHPVLSTGAAN